MCNQKGCMEIKIIHYNSYHAFKKNRDKDKIWYCMEHSKDILSIYNRSAKSTMRCVVRGGVKYWKNEADTETGELLGILQEGLGYKAFAEDFPADTLIEVTADVILPNHLNSLPLYKNEKRNC